MSCIKEIPTLKGDNYIEWKKKIDLAFILAEVDWVVTTPCPKEPVAPMREMMRQMLHGRTESGTLLS